jgi:hypothetical protein
MDEREDPESSQPSRPLESTVLSTSSFQDDIVDNDGFPQGCQFSPDGLCILTSRCNKLLLYNTVTTYTEHWKPVLECPSGDSVRSYVWYPHMRSNDPASCCFAGVSR